MCHRAGVPRLAPACCFAAHADLGFGLSLVCMCTCSHTTWRATAGVAQLSDAACEPAAHCCAALLMSLALTSEGAGAPQKGTWLAQEQSPATVRRGVGGRRCSCIGPRTRQPSLWGHTITGNSCKWQQSSEAGRYMPGSAKPAIFMEACCKSRSSSWKQWLHKMPLQGRCVQLTLVATSQNKYAQSPPAHTGCILDVEAHRVGLQQWAVSTWPPRL